MARPRHAAQILRFRRRCRSRWRRHQPLRCRSQGSIAASICARHHPWRPWSRPPMHILAAAARAPQPGPTRKPHRPPPVARGFLLWRISYTCRCPISFTHAAIQRLPLSPQHRSFKQASLGSRWCQSTPKGGCHNRQDHEKRHRPVERDLPYRQGDTLANKLPGLYPSRAACPLTTAK